MYFNQGFTIDHDFFLFINKAEMVYLHCPIADL